MPEDQIPHHHQPSILERHLQSLALGLLVLSAGWTIQALGDMRVKTTELQLTVGVMQNEMQHLKDQFKSAASDRYTNTDARIQDLTRMIMKIDKRTGGKGQ